MADPLPIAFVLTFWMVAGLMGLVAVVTLWGGRRESWTVWLATFGILMGVAYAFFGASALTGIVDGAPAWLADAPAIGIVVYLFGVGSLVLFVSVFPKRGGVFSRPLAGALLGLVGLGLVVLEITGRHVSNRSPHHPVGLLYIGYVSACYLTAAVLSVRSFQDSKSAAMARQTRIVATGILVISLTWVAELGTRLAVTSLFHVSETGAMLTRSVIWPALLGLGYLLVVPSRVEEGGPPGFDQELAKLRRFVGWTYAAFGGLWLLGHIAVVSQALGRPPSELMAGLTDTTILWTVQGRWGVLAVTLMGGVLRYGVLGIDPGAWRRGLIAVVGFASFAIVGAAALTGGPWVAGASAGVIGTLAVLGARQPREADRRPTRLQRRARLLYRERLSQVLEEGGSEDEVLDELREAFDLDEREHEMLAAVARAEAGLSGRREGAIAGRYTIEDRLGAGSFGVAYRVEDHREDRTLVLKRLHGEPGTSLPELEVARQVSHPNLTAIHEVLELDTGPAILMEYLAGGSVRDRYLDGGAVDPDRVEKLLDDTLAGLEALHDRGIAHGDLKPSNLLTTEDGSVKLADFGLASSQDRTVGETLAAGAGTPRYIPPEREGRTNPEPTDDLYAVGVIASELLDGGPESPDVPGAWEPFLDRAISEDPGRRFQTAREMRAALPSARPNRS